MCEYEKEDEVEVEWCYVCGTKRIGFGWYMYMPCDMFEECERWICRRCIDYNTMTNVDDEYVCPHHMNPTLRSMAFMTMKYQ